MIPVKVVWKLRFCIGEFCHCVQLHLFCTQTLNFVFISILCIIKYKKSIFTGSIYVISLRTSTTASFFGVVGATGFKACGHVITTPFPCLFSRLPWRYGQLHSVAVYDRWVCGKSENFLIRNIKMGAILHGRASGISTHRLLQTMDCTLYLCWYTG